MDLILCHPTKHPYLLQTEGYIYFQCSKTLAAPNLLQSPSAWGIYAYIQNANNKQLQYILASLTE